MRLLFDVYGEEEAAYELLRFADRMLDIRPALTKVAADAREQTAQRFEDEGPGWAPLAESTLARKAALGQPSAILQAEGDLLRSLTALGGDHVEVVADDSLLMATRDPKADYHQKGTSRMPARPIVDFSETQRRDHIRTIQRFIVEGIVL